MRILMLGWELPPHNSGGLGVACYQLCRALAGRGADIEFILPYTAEHNITFMKLTAAHPQGVTDIQVAVQAYDSYKYTFNDGRIEWLDVQSQQQLYELAVSEIAAQRDQEFDIIHAHDWLTFRAALRAKQQLNLPLVLHVHSVEHDRAGGTAGSPLVREIESTAMLMADRVIAVSQHTKNMIVRDYKIPAGKIEVVHNSLDISAMEPLDDHNAYKYLAAMQAQGYHVVTNVGRLTVQKNLTNVLRAAKEVVARAPKTLFLFVGAGEQRNELLELAAELGLARHVFFTGFLRGKPWRDAFAVGDLFVMPSISEPFGQTALEAIGYGTPILVSKQCGVNEVIHNSLKVDFWDVHEMANQIVAAVQNAPLRDELQRNAENELRKLSWDASARKLLRVFDKQLHGRVAAPQGATA